MTFYFGEQIFISVKASKQAYSGLYNSFVNAAGDKKMPPKGKAIHDTFLSKT